jgi:hypothetical protein
LGKFFCPSLAIGRLCAKKGDNKEEKRQKTINNK